MYTFTEFACTRDFGVKLVSTGASAIGSVPSQIVTSCPFGRNAVIFEMAPGL